MFHNVWNPNVPYNFMEPYRKFKNKYLRFKLFLDGIAGVNQLIKKNITTSALTLFLFKNSYINKYFKRRPAKNVQFIC